MRTLLLPLALIGAAATAGAQVLYVGGPDGVIRRGHPVFGDFQFAGVCGGPIDSMALDGEDLFIGDTNGNIYHYDASQNFVTYAFTLDTDATGLAVLGGAIFVSDSDGTVIQADKVTGQIIGTTTAPAPVHALHMIGTTLYAGSPFGVAFRRDVLGGPDWEFFGTCGGPVESLASDPEALILGTSDGSIYRIDFATQSVTATYGIGVNNDNTAMVYHQGDILVTASDGTLRRADAVSGRQSQEHTSVFDLQAMALHEDEPPGIVYCYGVGCPCGNDDPDAGCANSLGVGARLRATGSKSATADDLTLFATNVPESLFGVFFMSRFDAGGGTVGDGVLCSSGQGGFHRFGLLPSGAFGFYDQGELSAYAQTHFGPNAQIVAGATWSFQLWYRDPSGPCGGTFNTSNSYVVTFAP